MNNYIIDRHISIDKHTEVDFLYNEDYYSVVKAFRNWYIVTIKSTNLIRVGIVDSNNNIVLSIDKYHIFVCNDMIFVNCKDAFVWDVNGKYILEPQEEYIFRQHNGIALYKMCDSQSCHWHLFVPGYKPSNDTPEFIGIEKFNDELFKIFNGQESYWGKPIFGIINKHGKEVLPCQFTDIIGKDNILYLRENGEEDGYHNVPAWYRYAIEKNGHILAV